MTVIASLAEDVFPPLSVTVRLTVYVPLAVYVYEVASPLPIEPSPKDQLYSTIILSGSYDDEASKLTTQGASLRERMKVKLATGGELNRKQAVTKERIRGARRTVAVSLLLENAAAISLGSYISKGCQAR